MLSKWYCLRDRRLLMNGLKVNPGLHQITTRPSLTVRLMGTVMIHPTIPAVPVTVVPFVGRMTMFLPFLIRESASSTIFLVRFLPNCL